uniref:Uncharacterized protein n=1 Tax=Rhizophora mucronata TaxID=61149 RepID=A0A2P2NFB2_RHIMU
MSPTLKLRLLFSGTKIFHNQQIIALELLLIRCLHPIIKNFNFQI